MYSEENALKGETIIYAPEESLIPVKIICLSNVIIDAEAHADDLNAQRLTIWGVYGFRKKPVVQIRGLTKFNQGYMH